VNANNDLLTTQNAQKAVNPTSRKSGNRVHCFSADYYYLP